MSAMPSEMKAGTLDGVSPYRADSLMPTLTSRLEGIMYGADEKPISMINNFNEL